MGRSQETFNKKEREKKRLKKKEEKAKRKEERKNNSGSGDTITYVDKYGNFSSTPPPDVEKVDADDIVLGIPKKEDREFEEEEDKVKKGVVTFFNQSKGYGFIKEKSTGQSYFVHINNTLEPIVEQNMVTFETEKGPKGPTAVQVKVIR